MKRLKIISISVSIIIIGFVGFTLVSRTVKPVESSAFITNNIDEINGNQITEVPKITSELPIVKFDEVIAELAKLQQVNQDFLSRPGWYHYEKKTWNLSLVTQQESEDALFSTAGMFPPTQILEEWFQVLDNDATLGLGHFSVTSDENGNPVQVVVSDSQGDGGNLTLLERGLTDVFTNNVTKENEDVFINPVKLTSSIQTIIHGFERVKDFSPVIKAGLIIKDGIEEYQILIQTDVIDGPYEFEWSLEPVNGFITFYRIDPQTGIILETTDYDVGLSGMVYESFSEITLIAEIVDIMPVDVQQRYETALNQYMNLLEQGE